MTDFLKPVQVLHNGLWIQTVEQGVTMTDFLKPVQVHYAGCWLDATVVHLFNSGRAVVVCRLAFSEVAVTFDHLNCDIRNTPPAAETVAFDQLTVPKGAVWRLMSSECDERWSTISCFMLSVVLINGFFVSYTTLLESYRYSTDNGATWQLAGRTP